MTGARAGNAGFVLLDVLASLAIVAAIGTIVFSVTTFEVQRLRNQLDTSAAWASVQSVSIELRFVGKDHLSDLPASIQGTIDVEVSEHLASNPESLKGHQYLIQAYLEELRESALASVVLSVSRAFKP